LVFVCDLYFDAWHFWSANLINNHNPSSGKEEFCMVYKTDIIAESGLQFFGRISASISHEIKNVLAIINENAGLLEDFILMADRGKPIEHARLKTMAAAMQKQIGRADDILKNMNRFAHSIDEIFAEVDLKETIELFIALADKFIVMRGAQVDRQLPASPLTIQTAPFFLINLLWQCLEFCMSASGDEKRVKIVVEAAEDNIQIRFRHLTDLNAKLLANFPSDREKNLLKMLAADLKVEPEGEEVILQVSKIIGINTDEHNSP
jgi:C4-dicarboxylate-specific signal transduction histidine kinase